MRPIPTAPHPPTRHAGWWGQDIVPRIQWRVDVNEGEEIPDGYGIAYYRFDRPSTVCILEPLHLFVGAWRAFRHAMRFPPWRLSEWLANRRLADAWDAGYDEATYMRDMSWFTKRRNPYRSR